MAKTQKTDIILSIQVDGKKAATSLADYQKEIDRLKQSQNDLKKELKDGKITSDEYYKQFAKNKVDLTTTQKKTRELTKEMVNQKNALNLNKGSVEQMSLTLTKMRKRYDGLSASERKNIKVGGALQKNIQMLDVRLKQVDATTGRFQRSVGDYENKVGAAIKKNGVFSSGISKIGSSLGFASGKSKVFSGGIKKMGGAISNFFMGSVFAAIKAVTLLVGVVKNLINTSKNFAAQMSRVKAITGATNLEITKLTASAIKLGSTTTKTALEVAKLQEEFSKLGFTTKEILATTEATIRLSEATGEDLAESAKIAAGTIRGFGLTAMDSQRVVDVMAKSFSSSALDLQKFKVSMATVAPVAKNMNFSLEESIAMLSSLIDANLDASSAGAALRNIMLDLSDKELTMAEALDMINSSANKTGTALNLFGKRGSTAALILADNIEKTEELTEAYKNAKGAAKEMSDIANDNLLGDLNKLSSAWEGLQLAIDNGEGALGKFARTATQATTGLVNFMNSGEDVKLKKRIKYLKETQKTHEDLIAIKKLEGLTDEEILKFEIDLAKGKIKSNEDYVQYLKKLGKLDENVAKDFADARMKQQQIIDNLTKEQTENSKIAAAEEIKAKKEAIEKAEKLYLESKEYKAKVKAAKNAKDEENKIAFETQQFANSVLKDGIEKAKEAVRLKNENEVAALKKRLLEDETLTANSRKLINDQINLKATELNNNLAKLDVDEITRQSNLEQEKLNLKIKYAKKGSEEQLRLDLQRLELERTAAIAAATKKGLDLEKVNAYYDQLASERKTDKLESDNQKELEISKLHFETKLLEMQMEHESTLQLELEQKQLELESLQQLQGESNDAFNLRKLQKEKEVADTETAIKAKQVADENALMQSKLSAFSGITGAIDGIIKASGTKNKALLKVSRGIALANIYLSQAMAIANAIKTATQSSVSVWDLVANIGVAVGTVVASTVSAFSAVKKSESTQGFATGGYVSGSGSGTSDSIDAKLSNGESVNNAASTELFAPLYSALNQIGGGVPIEATGASSNVSGEDMLARAFAKGVANLPNPVVSVEDITTGNQRVEVIEQITQL